MKGRFSRIVMALVTLSMVLSAVAVVAPGAGPASAQSGGLNSWVRYDLPTTLHWQMAPNTDIWDLTAADDGTLFALVEDTSGPIDMRTFPGGGVVWDGLRWAVYPAWSDVALFKSTDGGYTWTLMWHMPASETGAPICVKPQPGYVDGDSNNGVVFIATGTRYRPQPPVGPALSPLGGAGTGDLYRSMDGGEIFTRITPRNPAILTFPGSSTIFCMDVAEDMDDDGVYIAVVGVSSMAGPNQGEGVYTWNEDGDRDWMDKQVANAMPPAPFPGTLPAGNGLNVEGVAFSPNYKIDGQIVAMVNDQDDWAGSPGRGKYLCFFDELDGAWGGDVDSPTTARVGTKFDGRGVSIAFPEDYSKTGNSCYVFVGLQGTVNGPGPNGLDDDVWRIQGLATVTGPSTATALGLGPILDPTPVFYRRISDLVFVGTAESGALYVGCEFPGPTGPPNVKPAQAQVYKCTQAALWPNWTPSFKPPSGAFPVFVTDMSGTLMAAGGGDGFTTGGVHVMVQGEGGRNVFNGRGLLDDIAVSEDIPGYVNPGFSAPLMTGTSWCLAEATAEEISPSYETDGLMYVTTFSEWTPTRWGSVGPDYYGSLSLWRWTDRAHWERILYEELTLPTQLSVYGAGGYDQFAGIAQWTNFGQPQATSEWTWTPRVSRDFSTDPYVFLLGGRYDSLVSVPATGPFYEEMLWYSPDKGDSWIPVDQMPIGAWQNNPTCGLTECGWWVEDNNTVFLGDYCGWVYRTADRGASWSEGALTSPDVEVDSIITSPNFNEDHTLLVGTFGWNSSTLRHEVWISQDGAEQDLKNIGAEICTHPTWADYWWPGGTFVNFDPGWASNHMIYAAASSFMDRWQLVGTGSTELTRIDYSDVGIYRTEVNLNEPSASTWEQVWDADDFNAAISKQPQAYPGMLPGTDVLRWAIISGVEVGSEGSLYVPFAVCDFSYNMNPAKPPSPGQVDDYVDEGGRFTFGGALRCLEPTQAVTEWDVIDQGLGEWDGLLWNRAVAGDSNTLVSLAWDWQEWRWKLAIYDDTLCTKSYPA